MKKNIFSLLFFSCLALSPFGSQINAQELKSISNTEINDTKEIAWWTWDRGNYYGIPNNYPRAYGWGWDYKGYDDYRWDSDCYGCRQAYPYNYNNYYRYSDSYYYY